MPQETLNQHRILVIDDEESSRKLARRLLERHGYQVLLAANGEEGLIVAKAEQPDCILLDIIMPKLNGFEVLRRLKADPDIKTIPVIVVSAKGAERDIATSFRLGAIFHVEKPYEIQDLLQKITVAFVRGTQNDSAPPAGSEEGEPSAPG